MASEDSRGGERGQSTPFFLCFLVVMLMFVGLIVNVGQAVNRRIDLQIAADAGAWTGATNMAIGMNALADVNGWRRDIQPLIDPGLYIAGAVGLDGIVKTIWEVATAVLDGVDAAVQVGYTKIPYDEAARVTWYNAQDLFPGEQLRWYEGYRGNLITSGDDTISNEVPFEKKRPTACWEQPFPFTQLPLPCLVDEEPLDASITYFVPCIIVYCPTTYDYIKWWRKSDFDVSFVWVVEAPPARPIYNPFGLFGDTAIPRMVAASHAKPVGGNIEEGESEYRVKFVPLSGAMSLLFAPEATIRGAVYDDFADKWRDVVY